MSVLIPYDVNIATESRACTAGAVCSLGLLHAAMTIKRKYMYRRFFKSKNYSNFHLANHFSLKVSPTLIRKVFSFIKLVADRTH